jgi:hypothetical protein
MSDSVEVRILGVPLGLYRQAAEHADELQREFALILLTSEGHEKSVPARLVRLMADLQARFGQFGDAQRGELLAALDRQEQRTDVTYRLPPEAKKAAATLSNMLDEADAYCRAGEHLLTLAASAESLAFRRWFLGEFVAQIDGAPPTRWDESSHAVALDA